MFIYSCENRSEIMVYLVIKQELAVNKKTADTMKCCSLK